MNKLDHAQQLKAKIRYYEIWMSHNHCDGWEKLAVKNIISRLKEQQYQLAREL